MVFNYYRYATDDSSGNPHPEAQQKDVSPAPGNTPNASKSRPIHPRPAVSLLLEPRSLVITADDLYRTYLHGIDAFATDHFVAHGTDKQSVDFEAHPSGEAPVFVANWGMLGGDDEEIMRVVKEGGVLKRGTRTSLTCRVVEKVAASAISAFRINKK